MKAVSEKTSPVLTVMHHAGKNAQAYPDGVRHKPTLKSEVIERYDFADLLEVQRRFDPWRHIYNHEGPHQAPGMATPAEHYQPSTRRLPTQLAPVEYLGDDFVRKVQQYGRVSFQGERTAYQ